MSTPIDQNEDKQKPDFEPQQLPSDHDPKPITSEEADQHYGERMKDLLRKRQQIEQKQQ